MNMTVNLSDDTELQWDGLVPNDINKLVAATFEQENVTSIVIFVTKTAWDLRQ